MTRIDATLVRRNLRSSAARYRVVLVFMALAAAALLVLSAIVGQGAAVLAERLSHASAVSSVKVLSESATSTVVQLNEANLKRLAEVPHVRTVSPWAQEGLLAEDESLWADAGTPVVFWATPRIAYAQPKIIEPESANEVPLGNDQIILPSQIGSKRYAGLVGSTFTFSYTVATGESSGVDQKVQLTVVGLYDNSVPGSDGQSAAYVSQELESRLIAARSGLAHASSPGPTYVYPAAYVDVDDIANVTTVQAQLVAANFNVSSIASQVSELPGLLRLLSYVNTFIAVVLLLFCLGSGIAIGSAWLAERGREIGLLRALGWTRQRVFRALVGEIAAAGLLCGVIGALVGLAGSVLTSQAIAGQTLKPSLGRLCMASNSRIR